jgi:hypothetical protein
MTWSINYVLAMRRDGPRVAYIFSILDVSHWKIPSLRMSQLPSPKAGSFPVEMFLARSLESYLAPRRHTCVASVAPRHHFYIFLNASRAGVLRFHLNDTALESAGFPLSQGPVRTHIHQGALKHELVKCSSWNPNMNKQFSWDFKGFDPIVGLQYMYLSAQSSVCGNLCLMFFVALGPKSAKKAGEHSTTEYA